MYKQSNIFGLIDPPPPPKKELPLKPPPLQMITKPRGKAGEYSPWALSMYSGCGNHCTWGCYVVARADDAKKAKFHSGAVPRYSNTKTIRDPLEVLEKDLRKLSSAGYGLETNILMSFGTDPYNPNDAKHELTRRAIELIQAYGLSFTVLTKGGSRALRDIGLFRPDGIDCFATTLTFINADDSAKSERNGASPQDRIKTIRAFHNEGIKTWVSLEPIVNPTQVLELIDQTHTFVDEYKIGKWNYNAAANKINWQKTVDDIIDKLKGTTANYMFKSSLWEYLGDRPRVVEAKWNKYSELSQARFDSL